MSKQDPDNKLDGPTVMYGPDGDARVFHHHKDIPDGWLDDPAKHAPGKPAPAAKAALPLTREEIIAALTTAEIDYPKTAGVAKLYDLLLTELRLHLTAEKVAFPADADAKALLALATPAS